MRDAFIGPSDTAESGRASGTGAAVQAAPTVAVVTPRAAMPEAERAKRIRSFAAAYGPLTLSYEKNWDGRVVESVLFTHQNRRIKLPLSMVLDSAKPESLEGYFVVYPAVGSPGKGTVTYKITGSSAVPPAPKQPSTVTTAVEAEPKPATAAGEASAAATTAAVAGAQQAAADRAGRRAGRRGGRGMRGG